MNKSLRTGTVMVAAMFLLSLAVPTACGRRSPAEKQLIDQLTGTWEWKSVPHLGMSQMAEILEMSARGRWEKKTFMETPAGRKLVYMKRLPIDMVSEPDTADAVKKLKDAGYVPAIETGSYRVRIVGDQQFIQMDKEKSLITSADAAELGEQPLLIKPPDSLQIGGRLYQRVKK